MCRFLLFQKTKAADQMAIVASSLQHQVEEFQRAFNARKIAKAVSKAKEMRTRMEYSMEPTLERLITHIVKQAQTKTFWKKLDEAVVKLCDRRNEWLNEVFLDFIVPQIENMVVGFPGRPNGRMNINAFFEIQLNAISDWIIRLGAAIADGPTPAPLSDPGRLLPRSVNGSIQDSWPFSAVLPNVKEAFDTLLPSEEQRCSSLSYTKSSVKIIINPMFKITQATEK